MPVVSPQIAAMKDWRTKFINMVADLLPQGNLPPPPGNMPVTEPGTWQGAAQQALGFLIPQPEDTLIAPAELRPNFRSPQQIQALRRMMAEEQRARGAIGTYHNFDQGELLTHPDPIDQILRGSWYHGMSEKARGKYGGSERWNELSKNSKSLDELSQGIGFNSFNDFKKNWEEYLIEDNLPLTHENYVDALISNLDQSKMVSYLNSSHLDSISPNIFNQGFPLSVHDTQSISNKLGEPAGVSLSLNPTVSSKFSADPNIFRVMPLYGGPPTERTVNLMTPQGRNALNDAYDVVANQRLLQSDPNILRNAMFNLQPGEGEGALIRALQGSGTGQFNQQLSNQLQNQGYRHILYNPQRWNEYEMLALDPKYALPLDYRGLQEYIDPLKNRLGTLNNPPDHLTITPKASEGLENIRDITIQNASRLGDIYSERSWWDRLSEQVKQMLLQDNPQAEQIIQKLKGGT